MRNGFLGCLGLLLAASAALAQTDPGTAPHPGTDAPPPPANVLADPPGRATVTSDAPVAAPAAPPPAVGSATPAAPSLAPLTPFPNYGPPGTMPWKELSPLHPDCNPPPPPSSPECFWFSIDAMVGILRPAPLQPLVGARITSSIHPAVLDRGDSQFLYGGRNADRYLFGPRAEVGFFLDECQRCSLSVGGFFLFPQHERFAARSSALGDPTLSRPYLDANTGALSAFPIAEPGVLAGGVVTDLRSQLFGFEGNLGWGDCVCPGLRITGLLGFRSLFLDEDLSVYSNSTALVPGGGAFLGYPVGPGSILEVGDRIGTTNRFYGGQLGAQVRWNYGCLCVDAYGKIGLGVTQQRAHLAGASRLTVGNSSVLAPGGVLAGLNNAGDFSRNEFGTVPQFGINLAFNVHPCVRFRTGYSFLLWNDVVRPGDQIDPVVNPAYVPTDRRYGSAAAPARPAFNIGEQTLWLHTLSVGMEFHY